jgi:multidrug resistance efflux pump
MSSPNDGSPSGTTATEPGGTASNGAASDGGGAPQKPAGRRRLKRSTRVALLIILVVALIAAGVFAASYFLDARNYVSTDNAQIDGNRIAVNAPASGTLIDWRATQGAELTADQVVGRIKVNGGFVQPQQSIRAPADGTVAVDSGVEGAFVTAGTQLAVAYDFSKVYVTARVDETDIDAIRIGQRVEFTVDAFPDNEFTGSVREIQGGAAGVFSLFPQSNSSGTFQKVTQVIPVKISIDDLQGLNLVPGMNVTVKIDKRT